MRGSVRDKIPRPDIRSKVTDSRAYRLATSNVLRMYVILGSVALAMTLGVAGILSGFGLYMIALFSTKAPSVILSSILLSFSTATTLLCYGWMTE